MDTSVLSAVVQPFVSGLLSYVVQAGIVAILGLGVWALNWVRIKVKGNVIGESLFNLALRYLHAKSEDPKVVGNVVDYLKKHKPAFISDADFDAGMRAAMAKAEASLDVMVDTNPK